MHCASTLSLTSRTGNFFLLKNAKVGCSQTARVIPETFKDSAQLLEAAPDDPSPVSGMGARGFPGPVALGPSSDEAFCKGEAPP